MRFIGSPNFLPEAVKLLKQFDERNDIEEFPYPPATPNVTWMQQLAKGTPKPFILSLDDNMLGNRVERAVLCEYGCHFIYFKRGWAKMDWDTFAWKLIKYWPKIVEKCSKAGSSTLIEVSINGRVDVGSL